jgi:MFS family permease
METVFLNVGITLAFVVVYLLSFTVYAENWRLPVALAALPPGICMTLVWRLPESPRWLRLTGLEAEARNNMQLVCDDSEVVETFKFHVESTAPWAEVLYPEPAVARRAMLIGIGLAMYQMLGGISVLLNFSTTILGRDFSHRDAVLGSSIMSGAKLAAACTAVGIVDVVGRRRMLLGSTIAMTVSFGLLALAFASSAGYWIKVALLACITVSFTLGLGSAAYAVLVEVFASSHRAKATALAFAASRWSSALTLGLFPIADEAFGTAACFLYFSGINATAWLFVYTCVPETGWYKLEEIADAIASHAKNLETTAGSGETQ